MAGIPKPTARQAFDLNVADAEALVAVVRALRNRRVRRMRPELRERLGSALDLPRRDWDDLDCIESDDLFAVFKPGSQVDRESVSEPSLRPLLRQALVAAVRLLRLLSATESWSGCAPRLTATRG